MKHQNISITTDNGTDVLAQAPIIISASRATDIPAFYSDWFFRRLEKGYIRWRNPFSGQDSYVSFVNTRFIVFWSKNPAPLLPYLPMLEERGIGYYIQFTLNNYGPDGLEPNVPPLAQRIDTFRRLVDTLGSGGVVWRFDPLILTDKINIDTLLEKIAHIADALVGHAEKLVFSFADINTYKKVSRNLRLSGINYREWDEESMREFALRFSTLNHDNWNLRLATCTERIDLSEYGIEHNRCIDLELINRLAPHDAILQNFLYNAKTDTGQRKACGCILSKDIGAYNTCPHGCLYCYANTSPTSAFLNYKKHLANSNLTIPD
jgi:DNA repair photolyase